MSIRHTRVELTGIIDALAIDMSLPSQLADAHVDPLTIGEVTEAVDLAVEARRAEIEAANAEAAAAVSPDDENLQDEAAAARTRADTLAGAARTAAACALAGVDDRHGPIAEAIAAAGGSAEIADPTWYDTY